MEQLVRPDGALLMAARGGDYPAIAAVCGYYHPRLVDYACRAGLEEPEAAIGRAVTASLLAIDPARDPTFADLVPAFEQDLFLRIVADAGLDGVVTDEFDVGEVVGPGVAAVGGAAGPAAGVLGGIVGGAAGGADIGPAVVRLADEPEVGLVDWSELTRPPVETPLASTHIARRLGAGLALAACAAGVAVVGFVLARSDDGAVVGADRSDQALTAQPIDGGTMAGDGPAGPAQGSVAEDDGERSTVTIGAGSPGTAVAGSAGSTDDLVVATSSPSASSSTASSSTASSSGSSTTAAATTPTTAATTAVPSADGSSPTSGTSESVMTTSTVPTLRSTSSVPPSSSVVPVRDEGGLLTEGPPAPTTTTRPVGDFAGQVLDGDAFRGGDLTAYDFTGAVLQNVTFEAVDLSGVSFEGAVLRNVTIVRSDLTGADFRGATLDSVGFSGTDISGADFTGADLVSGSIDADWSFRNPPINLPSLPWWRR